MPQYIRMLEDRDGAHDHIHIVTYRAGEVYPNAANNPPISQDLLDGFVASGHAVEVDAAGNPVNPPAARRQTKPTGPAATKADDAAPASEPTEPAGAESTSALETSGSGAPEAPKE